MVRRTDLIRVQLTEHQRAQILVHARAAMLGGNSEIYSNDAARRANELPENQMIGLACEGAFAVWRGKFDDFLKRREERNKNPFQGDGRFDDCLPDGRKIDVKGSEPWKQDMRLEDAAMRLCLTADRKRLQDDFVYVMAVARRKFVGCAPDPENAIPEVVIFTGWCHGRDIRDREEGILEGIKGFSLWGTSLEPLSSLLGEQA